MSIEHSDINEWTREDKPFSQKERDFLSKVYFLSEQEHEKTRQIPGFSEDIEKVIQNPENQVEKEAFREKYLKGFWQRTMDGRDFASLDEKAVDGLTRAEKKAYYAWKNEQLDATIMGVDKENMWKNATIMDKQERARTHLKELDALLSPKGKSEIDAKISQIQSNPSSPEYQELKRNWASDTDIQSGKFSDLLKATYVVNHHSEFISNGWVDQVNAPAFLKVSRNFADILGKDFPAPVIEPFLRDTMISWDRKERTLDEVRRIVDTGRYDTGRTTYNGQTGYIVFRSQGGDTARIDTRVDPPRIEYSRAGITIGKEVEPITSEERERTALSRDVGKLQWEVADDHRKLSLVNKDAIPVTLESDELALYMRAREAFEWAKSAEEKSSSLRILREQGRSLESLRRRSLTPETMNDKSLLDLEWALFREDQSLGVLETSLASYVAKSKLLEKYRDLEINPNQNFDSIASKNLSWLTSDEALFQRMGSWADQAFHRMIDEVNRTRNEWNKIRLGERELSLEEKNIIKGAYNTLLQNLGYDRSVLRSAQVGDLEQAVLQANAKWRDERGSVESLMKAK
jgi:hypothetical protein